MKAENYTRTALNSLFKGGPLIFSVGAWACPALVVPPTSRGPKGAPLRKDGVRTDKCDKAAVENIAISLIDVARDHMWKHPIYKTTIVSYMSNKCLISVTKLLI